MIIRIRRSNMRRQMYTTHTSVIKNKGSKTPRAILGGKTKLNLYFPMSFGITAALAIVTYIGAWNQFWWPFIMTTQEEKFTVTIAISSVQDAFGVRYAREMALAVLAGFPVAAAYLVFQKKVTNALMMTSGIKG